MRLVLVTLLGYTGTGPAPLPGSKISRAKMSRSGTAQPSDAGPLSMRLFATGVGQVPTPSKSDPSSKTSSVGT